MDQDTYLSKLRSAIEDIIDDERFQCTREQILGVLERRISALLIGEMRAGRLRGGTPRQAFYVHCVDPTANPLELEIGVALHKPVEFVIIRVAPIGH